MAKAIIFNDKLHEDRYSDLGINWDAMKQAVKELFGEAFNHPVRVEMTLRLKRNNVGFWFAASHEELTSKRSIRGLSDRFMNDVEETGYYHNVKIGGKEIARGLHSFMFRDAGRCYRESHVKRNPYVFNFVHVLCHELAHAMQYDHCSFHDASTLRGAARVRHNSRNIDHSEYRAYFRTPIEFDAEAEARQAGPILLERYWEIININNK